MTEERKGEGSASSGEDPLTLGPKGEQARATPLPPPPPRRELLARSPVYAVLMAALAGWLLASLWPDVSFFFSSRTPIDLGGSGAYRLDSARENRLVQIRGSLEQPEFLVRVEGGPRSVGRLIGTNLLVDHPGVEGLGLYEGRLLPVGRRADYAPLAKLTSARGAPLGDGWLVLRDGERPRHRWFPVVSSALLLAVLAINLRALVRALFLRPRERR